MKKLKLVGSFTIKILNGIYLIRTHFSDSLFVKKRAEQFMDEYFGEYQYLNLEKSMKNRRMGFEDGYLACLKDLKIKLRYNK